MTLPATSQKLGSRLPSQDERKAADALRPIIASALTHKSVLKAFDPVTQESATINLHPVIGQLLLDVLRHIGIGDAVTLVPTGKMMTTQQAADILNVSRPYLVKLLDEGHIPHEKINRHRRIKAEDLFAYKDRRDTLRGKALDAMAKDDAELL